MDDLHEFALAKARFRKALWMGLGDDLCWLSGGMARRPFAELARLAYTAAIRADIDERRILDAKG